MDINRGAVIQIIEIAIREREWRLEDGGCGSDEIMASVDKLRSEISSITGVDDEESTKQR